MDPQSKPQTTATSVEVDHGSEDRRLDNFLISMLRGVPHSHIYGLIRTGQVRVNSKRAKPAHRLKTGDRVRIPPVRTSNKSNDADVSPTLKNAVREIIYEDDFLVVINKPAGVTVHAGTRHSIGFIEAMRKERPDYAYIELVHRIDKNTSGILLLAKDKKFLRDLHSIWRRESLTEHLEKHYSALLKGNWTGDARNIESREMQKKPKPMNATATEGTAVSRFLPVQRYGNCTLVDITLYTGKTHQARRHAMDIGYPIAGDSKYGDRNFNTDMRKYGLKRMFLHAQKITIFHPAKRESVTFESELPPELTHVLENLETMG